ncbi:hypothetical protein [Polaribacter butkevichii]|uniref:Uncharacterized protein n=1 Tax=Polaribacter butkevichii TaxID=218490 RepID=A0A2P6C858_9FLAO|nr:hypothetical protein [Polaribacter butkevichii]PQJ69116.1 hypothetical protein BTO14_13885 [Polaribacter butkevichii]
MSAIQVASQVDKINFPEFTASLITGVFDAITANQIKQMAAYTEMLSKVSKSLTSFVNETKDDITGGELLEFLSNTFSYEKGNAVKTMQYGEVYDKLQKGTAIDNEAKTKLTDELTVKDGANVIVPAISKTGFLDAVKARISENKYKLLRDMMKLGYQKLVVKDGKVETKLEFFTQQYEYDVQNTSEFERKNRSWGFGGSFKGGFLGGILGINGGISNTSTKVSTVNTSKVDMSNTTVDIFGHVSINFKSDFFPLANFQ